MKFKVTNNKPFNNFILTFDKSQKAKIHWQCWKERLNPLSPNIPIQILQTNLYTFPLGVGWENLFADQSFSHQVIIIFINAPNIFSRLRIDIMIKLNLVTLALELKIKWRMIIAVIQATFAVAKRKPFHNCKGSVYNCNDHHSFNSSLCSSHTSFSYIHNFMRVEVSNLWSLGVICQKRTKIQLSSRKNRYIG